MDFEEVYTREFPGVYKYLLALCGNPTLAEELTQETFYRAIQNSGTFRGTCKLSVWLCQIGKNLYISQLRQERYRNFTVEYQTKSGKKQAIYYNQGFKRKLEAMGAEVSFLPQYLKYDRFNSLKNRIKLGLCELCGKKSDNISLHQVKRMKDLTGNSAWELLMLERRRKTLAVCPECHSKIHS